MVRSVPSTFRGTRPVFVDALLARLGPLFPSRSIKRAEIKTERTGGCGRAEERARIRRI